MSASTHAHAHEEHAHRPVSFYLLIAAILTGLTFIEIGPLFEWYNLPVAALMVLSAVKFAIVVAFFMHLWDDAKVFTQIFTPPLLGATAMVVVMMALASGFAPSPGSDPFPVEERYWTNYNGACTSWLRSHQSNRWYCASPAIDQERLFAFTNPQTGGATKQDVSVDLAGKSGADLQAALFDEGKRLYEQNCHTCHGADGAGVPGQYPPLAGSDYIADATTHVNVILKGLSGPITVNGQAYNGAMNAFGDAYTDAAVAAIATYERNAWGNAGGLVTPEQVAAAR